ncbi:hypothetical protein HJFPF1_09799 [Paramyrothecium foliicola]|nr:hypothetical protein HJFPF1_09799 [Paramyrothecium foliicola]
MRSATQYFESHPYALIFSINTRQFISSAIKMRAAAVFSILSLVTGGHAWAQAANGEWIANNKIYDVTNSGFAKATYEACTYRNAEIRIPLGTPCKWWLDGNGRIAYGRRATTVSTAVPNRYPVMKENLNSRTV